jgi:hypothetical protein
MELKANDFDRICMRDYAVGMGWFVFSMCSTFVVVFFERLPISILIAHSEGFGKGQMMITILGVANIALSLWYLLDTAHKQKYLGL